MTDTAAARTDALGRPWLALCLALALHFAEEAHVGFLPVYEDAVRAVRELFPFVRSPSLALAAGMWLAVGLVAALMAILPFAYRGAPWMRVATIGLALITLANVSGHIGGSILAGRLMPGIYTIPLLAASGIYALAVAWRWRPVQSCGCEPA